MSSSDNQATPSTSGDGNLFDAYDAVLGAPTTTERTVELQSGYLVVLRHLEDKLTLAFKRRLGTPPSSIVSLLPDECLKLSRALSSSADAEYEGLSEAQIWQERAAGDLGLKNPNFFASRNKRYLKRLTVALAIICFIVGGLPAFFWGMYFGSDWNKGTDSQVATVSKTAIAAISLENDPSVDSFTRSYIADLLDFSPATYKYSQISAMAMMSSELAEKYWHETGFPLDSAKLPKQSTNIMIKRITKEPVDANTLKVNVFADVSIEKQKVVNPLHLQLLLKRDKDGALKILEQADMTAKAST